MNKICGEIQEKLAAFAERELPTVEYLRVHLHVGACRDCRAELRQVRALLADIPAALAHPDPEADLNGLWAAIDEAEQRPAKRPARNAFGNVRRVAAAAAVVAAVVSGPILYDRITAEPTKAKSRPEAAVQAIMDEAEERGRALREDLDAAPGGGVRHADF